MSSTPKDPPAAAGTTHDTEAPPDRARSRGERCECCGRTGRCAREIALARHAAAVKAAAAKEQS